MNAGDADKNVQWYQRAANSALVTFWPEGQMSQGQFMPTACTEDMCEDFCKGNCISQSATGLTAAGTRMS